MCVSGWTWLPCQVEEENVPGTSKHGQHLVAVPNDMLAVVVNSSSKHALPRRRQTEKYLQNCSGAPRVSSSPPSTCSALQHNRKPVGQPGHLENTTLPTSGPAVYPLIQKKDSRSMCAGFAAHGCPAESATGSRQCNSLQCSLVHHSGTLVLLELVFMSWKIIFIICEWWHLCN